jgi:serine/threonine protein kinase
MSTRSKKQKTNVSLLSNLRVSGLNLVDFVETATEKSIIAKTSSSLVMKCVSNKKEVYAIKVMKLKQRFSDDAMVLYLYALEFKIASFLSSPSFAEICPHFCGVFAYQFSERSINEECAIVETQKVNPIMLMELCDMNLKEFALSCKIEEEVTSVVLQIIYAILCMQSVGISHNDLYVRNILVSKTKNVSHLYDMGDKSLCLKTFGYSVRICDFGLASCYDYNDERGPLTYFYYPDRHLTRPLDILCADHPLKYSHVREGERDFMSALTDIFRLLTFSGDTLRNMTNNLRDYLFHFIVVLDETTPQMPDGGVEFARKMLDAKEIAEFMSTMSLFGTENPDCVFEMPTKQKKEALQEDILRILDKDICKDRVY